MAETPCPRFAAAKHRRRPSSRRATNQGAEHVADQAKDTNAGSAAWAMDGRARGSPTPGHVEPMERDYSEEGSAEVSRRSRATGEAVHQRAGRIASTGHSIGESLASALYIRRARLINSDGEANCRPNKTPACPMPSSQPASLHVGDIVPTRNNCCRDRLRCGKRQSGSVCWSKRWIGGLMLLTLAAPSGSLQTDVIKGRSEKSL
jgi:hypothetical protein